MKTNVLLPRLLLFALLLAAGCATSKIDWAARVGHYSFDQAVAELGPPDKQAKLTDGTVVAEWLIRRGYREVYATSLHPYYYYYGMWPPTHLETYRPDSFLRLTFSPTGPLSAWKRYSR